ncbi:MAG: MBL fold metallo-hydrolase [Caulobacter sp.]|nr:MBL fold metallo-hydrolase [Caulobacter sp.]
MKRVFTGLLVVLVLLAAGAWAVRGRIALRIMERRLAAAMANPVIPSLPDGLHVAICGAGGPFPDHDRGGPCTAVIAGKRMFIVDTGEAAGRTLGRMGLFGTDSVVLLTHFHSDHIDGLGNVALQRWGAGNLTTPLRLYGPPGVERVAAGFTEAYALDAGYRTAHHGPVVMPPSGAGVQARPFAIPEGQDSVVVLDEDGVKITAFRVNHGPIDPAVGYRFDYRGRSVVISGDTASSPVVAKYARGVDLLVHEALSTPLVNLIRQAALAAGNTKRAQIMLDIQNYHTSPSAAAAIARDDKVGALLLNHIVPPLPLRALEGPFLGDARKVFTGPLWIARDGDLVSLPASDRTITRTSLLR